MKTMKIECAQKVAIARNEYIKERNEIERLNRVILKME